MRAGRQAGMGGGDVDGACNGRACSVEGKGRLESEHRARATHPEHTIHIRDAGGVPVGDVRIKIIDFIEEPPHVGDGRDVPVGDGAVCRNGGIRVVFVSLDRRLQVGRARERIGRHVCLGGAPAHNLGRI